MNASLLSAERVIHGIIATRLILFTRKLANSVHVSEVMQEDDDDADGDGDGDDVNVESSKYEDSDSAEIEEVELQPTRTLVSVGTMPVPAINEIPPSPTLPGHDRIWD